MRQRLVYGEIQETVQGHKRAECVHCSLCQYAAFERRVRDGTYGVVVPVFEQFDVREILREALRRFFQFVFLRQRVAVFKFRSVYYRAEFVDIFIDVASYGF